MSSGRLKQVKPTKLPKSHFGFRLFVLTQGGFLLINQLLCMERYRTFKLSSVINKYSFLHIRFDALQQDKRSFLRE